MPDELANSVLASHVVLTRRLDETNLCSFPRRARDQHARIDSFLVTACRHISAVSTVLAGEVARLGHEEQARRLTAEYHALLLALLRAKGRLCGAAQLARTPWHKSWSRVVDQLEALTVLEREAVLVLTDAHAPPTLERMAHRMHRGERRAPTRPHPFIPTRGLLGRFAMTFCSRVDAIWDSVEGRPTTQPAPLLHAA